MEITDIQHARAIIAQAGESYQNIVVEKLRGTYWEIPSNKEEEQARRVLSNIEHEYVLNVANVIWADNYEKLPQWIKDYDK